MSSIGAKNLALSSAFLLLLVGFATSDINQDKAECTDKLLGLAGCLPYVGGEAKVPAMDCCSGIREVIDKSKRCLCILIKDRDDPNLGLKINVTLALSLPDACQTPTNITQCVDLLHLAPNSTEAKVFEGFKNALTNKTSPSSVPGANNATANGTSTSANNNSSSGWGKRWLVTEVLCGILPFVFISHLFLFVV
ncbi:hypothetical protein AAZX31_05G143800 [Glycine max]|uniref:Bifunctional inhibitor/plant lipid transfer protein/seed storage helical domain-containing protein n=1 Tax=Glycine max TaxID=3847 RepID=I1K3U8_SOYBN|nr:alpha-amylase inhibitor/lipid transfer/seed storage family protein isoform 1 precursor [Glycine max]KAG5029464.1 hypothetical protein JHK87_012978 [Glycine soja]KAG5040948.1 hypothetical protein JHK85_013424 [Glycine max]KAG5058088.1 hypothetical protein JHK86_013084 [Glycine max]KAG5155089.1 hypothetical protein JHK82_013058 [Glycine max]KAH1134584.1 hypothetical protein GYH30_012769 [Glycine max]|eukprot:XP_006579354.1 alpha-amylase inhibitor/lipid transfer/seed storage family protein isoform X1 [Glycine max]